MNLERFTQPLDEVLRPTHLHDLLLPDVVLAALRNMIAQRRCANMLFHGSPGIGKTSAARIFVRELTSDQSEYIHFNGASELDPHEFRKRLMSYVSTLSFTGRGKVCVIDEAEFLPPKSQTMLRSVIEDMHENCRFILTANEVSRVQDAVRSRLNLISFDVRVKDVPQMRTKAHGVLRRKLEQASIEVSDAMLDDALSSFPHMRRVAKDLEFSLTSLGV